MSVIRQTTRIVRSFPDYVYGGEQAALAMAMAYRDAAMHLLPPETNRHRRTKLRALNRSGIAGVLRAENRGIPCWIAMIGIEGRKKSKSFSIAVHGEERAKKMAIDARKNFLQGCPDGFMTAHAHATAAAQALFPHVLQSDFVDIEEQPQIVDAETSAYLVKELDAWFATLRPLSARVYMRDSRSGPRHRLGVIVSDGGLPARVHKKGLSMDARSLRDTLLVAWSFVKESITTLHGVACWRDFEARHKEAFFSYACGERFRVWQRYDKPDRAKLFEPPASLAPYLPDFTIPSNC